MSRFLLSFSIIAFYVVGQTGLSIAYAADAKLAVTAEEFSEDYKRSSNVSSAGVLVGLTLGSAPNWSVKNVSVLFPDSIDKNICLRTTTVDGLFWSENPFTVTAASPSEPTQLGPLSVKFEKILKAMPDENMAFRVAIPKSNDCDDLQDARFIPVLGSNPNLLSMLVNSGDKKLATRLASNGEPITKTVWCQPVAQEARSAADRRCEIEVGGITGDYNLQFVFVGMTGKRDVMEFPIYIPTRTK